MHHHKRKSQQKLEEKTKLFHASALKVASLGHSLFLLLVGSGMVVSVGVHLNWNSVHVSESILVLARINHVHRRGNILRLVAVLVLGHILRISELHVSLAWRRYRS